MYLGMYKGQRRHEPSQRVHQRSESARYWHVPSTLFATRSNDTVDFTRTIVSTLSVPPPTKKLSPAHVTSINCLFPPSGRVSTSCNCLCCIARWLRQPRSSSINQPANPRDSGA